MTKKFKLFIIMMILLCTNALQAQVFQDTSSFIKVKNCIGFIYNFQFGNAAGIIESIERSYPHQPIGYLLNGINIYWKNYPLTSNSSDYTSYISYMRKCIGLCEQERKKGNEIELLLTNLCARGMLLLFYSENKMTMDVIPLASSTYPYLRQAFKNTGAYSDFFFFTGLYNYYHEAYPEAHPVYKPLALLFPKGDKLKGLSDLHSSAANSIFLKAESALFLSDIYLSFENNAEQSLIYSKSLHELYPCNSQYLAKYIVSLLLEKQYDEAENLIKEYSRNNENLFLKAQTDVFIGIIQEKKYSNQKQAELYYNKGIDELKAFPEHGNNYAAYAYFGLSRIAGYKGDNKNMKEFRKKATEMTDSKNIDFD